MNVVDIIKRDDNKRTISIEILPPLKGTGTDSLFRMLDMMAETKPAFVNITTHHSEFVYRQNDSGMYEKTRIRRRPGTIAIAASIAQRYDMTVIPHVICSGTTIESTEYELIDLQLLGIENILLLRGDKAQDDKVFTPTPGGHAHTTDLIAQVNRFNDGFFCDGTEMKHRGKRFHYGVAAYPEKHEEAPNMEMDMKYLKMKQDMGAEYAVTQMFFDNRKYFDFVERARKAGITIPIIPGIKPLSKLSQMTLIPKTFHCDLPQELTAEMTKCHNDDDAKALGLEWATAQCEDLYGNGVKNIHLYTVSANDSVVELLKRLL